MKDQISQVGDDGIWARLWSSVETHECFIELFMLQE